MFQKEATDALLFKVLLNENMVVALFCFLKLHSIDASRFSQNFNENKEANKRMFELGNEHSN